MSHDHEADASIMWTQEFWDERYGSAATIWSGNPNPHLVAQVADLRPGTALDVGSGEGADAIWLAEQGWQVTGIDVSTVALERAAQTGRRRRSGRRGPNHLAAGGGNHLLSEQESTIGAVAERRYRGDHFAIQ